MKLTVAEIGIPDNFYLRNGLALTGLLAALYLPDTHAMELRSGYNKWIPYLFALILYCWLVFHNRVLFEQLYMQGKRRNYVGWTLFFLSFSSFNISLCLHYLFGGVWPVPMLIKFYVFTLTGFGVYIVFRYRHLFDIKKNPPAKLPGKFCITANGKQYELEPNTIFYIESLENYLRVFTSERQLLTRLTMKQAAIQLPEYFVKINRSCLVNIHHVKGRQGDELIVGNTSLRIGRTFKQYVNQQLAKSSF